jgi:hypothetical protein
MQCHGRSEPPVLYYQKFFKVHAGDSKMLTNVRNPGAMGRLIFLGDHKDFFDPSLRDDKRVGEIAALQELLLIEILPKVWDGINISNKGQFFYRGILEEIRIVSFQQANNGFIESALKFQLCFSHRDDLLVLKGNVKLFPEGREPITVVMSEDV